jgi:imidazoleglycerol phosphate dehydratase HisB
VWFGFKGNWALIGKTGMKADAVIEGFHVIEDSGTSLGQGVEAMMIDQFVFETAKERFNKSVVVAVAFSAH